MKQWYALYVFLYSYEHHSVYVEDMCNLFNIICVTMSHVWKSGYSGVSESWWILNSWYKNYNWYSKQLLYWYFTLVLYDQHPIQKLRWNDSVVILTYFSSMVAPEVVNMTTSGVVIGEYLVKMSKISFQCMQGNMCHNTETYTPNLSMQQSYPKQHITKRNTSHLKPKQGHMCTWKCLILIIFLSYPFLYHAVASAFVCTSNAYDWGQRILWRPEMPGSLVPIDEGRGACIHNDDINSLATKSPTATWEKYISLCTCRGFFILCLI